MPTTSMVFDLWSSGPSSYICIIAVRMGQIERQQLERNPSFLRGEPSLKWRFYSIKFPCSKLEMWAAVSSFCVCEMKRERFILRDVYERALRNEKWSLVAPPQHRTKAHNLEPPSMILYSMWNATITHVLQYKQQSIMHVPMPKQSIDICCPEMP